MPIIELDSPLAQELGFTSDLFNGWLWKDGEDIIVSFIESKQPGRGNLRRLFDTIEQKGFGLKVPTPFARMQKILEIRGMVPTQKYDPKMQEYVEVWTKPPKET